MSKPCTHCGQQAFLQERSGKQLPFCNTICKYSYYGGKRDRDQPDPVFELEQQRAKYEDRATNLMDMPNDMRWEFLQRLDCDRKDIRAMCNTNQSFRQWCNKENIMGRMAKRCGWRTLVSLEVVQYNSPNGRFFEMDIGEVYLEYKDYPTLLKEQFHSILANLINSVLSRDELANQSLKKGYIDITPVPETVKEYRLVDFRPGTVVQSVTPGLFHLLDQGITQVYVLLELTDENGDLEVFLNAKLQELMETALEHVKKTYFYIQGVDSRNYYTPNKKTLQLQRIL